MAAIRFPSISASSRHQGEMRDCAGWLAGKFTSIGCKADVIDVPGGQQPIVRADLVVSPAAPTLTIYGHYDVQPPEPLEQWVTPPFEPSIRGNMLFGRGACDNKGNHVAALRAVKCLRDSGELGVNVRFLVEGEEETTGLALPLYVRGNAAELRSDYTLIWDGGFDDFGFPQITVSMRGELYVEIHVQGPAYDLHSGYFGGVAPNPLNTLAHILASLKDRAGRIAIPGFYDGVDSADHTSLFRADELDDAYEQGIRQAIGIAALEGEAGYAPAVRRTLRPTLDVNGFIGGFTGEGEKTIIPANAMAKVSMRLVAGQDPDAIFASLERHVQAVATAGVQVRVLKLGGCRSFFCPSDHYASQAAQRAFQEAFGKEARPVMKGSTIPVAADLIKQLQGQTVVSGLGQPDASIHAPNEHLSLDHFHRGIETLIHFIAALPDGPSRSRPGDHP